MKLDFKIDSEYDAYMVFQMLRGKDFLYRANEMGLDSAFAKKIHGSSKEVVKKDIDLFVQQDYKKVLPFIKDSLKLYQQSWDEIITEFSSTVEKLTLPWVYDKYTCVVTHFNAGVSNWDGNVVARWWKENPYIQRRITAHEILLAHYFSLYRKHFSDCNLKDSQVWQLAEISSFALTGLEPSLNKFWPWDSSGYYTDHNYPELVELQNALEVPFLKRSSFLSYMETGIKMLTQGVS